MKSGLLIIIFLGLILTSCTTKIGWNHIPPAEVLDQLTLEDWLADLAVLGNQLPKRNPHFRHDPAMAQRFLASLSEAEQILRGTDPADLTDIAIAAIARSLAVVGEGHTSLNSSPSTYFPLVVRWLADGLFVAATDQAYNDYLGARVLGVYRATGEFVPLKNLEPILNRVISVDHPNGYRHGHGGVLTNPHLIRGLGIAGSQGLEYLLELNQSHQRLTVQEIPGESINLIRVYDHALQKPMVLQSREENWFRRLNQDPSVIYVHYGHCTTDAFGMFQAMLTDLEQQPTRRLIIDLRYNSGGNSIPGTWFSRQLANTQLARDPSSILVLVGPGTFSSGMWMAIDLMHRTQARFLGQPVAANPDWYGEVGRFELPRSGLIVGHSTKRFNYSRRKNLRLDSENMIIPDPGFAIMPTFEEYRNGIDPVFDAALSY